MWIPASPSSHPGWLRIVLGRCLIELEAWYSAGSSAHLTSIVSVLLLRFRPSFEVCGKPCARLHGAAFQRSRLFSGFVSLWFCVALELTPEISLVRSALTGFGKH